MGGAHSFCANNCVCFAGFGAAVCLFNKVTKRAQAEVLRRMSRFCKTLNLSLGLVPTQAQPLPAVVSSPLRYLRLGIVPTQAQPLPAVVFSPVRYLSLGLVPTQAQPLPAVDSSPLRYLSLALVHI